MPVFLSCKTRFVTFGFVVGSLFLFLAASFPLLADLQAARDRQDLGALDKMVSHLQQEAQKTNTAEAQYQLALAYSYASEVAMETHDKRKAESYAETGLDVAKKAVAANGGSAEYHRVLGELCGQVIPANPFLGALKYGQCARDELNKALELNNKLALAYVSRGVGNFYLPASMGGGPDLAIQDFDKAIAIDPNLSDAYLWKGVTLRKANREADARQALQKALQLDPNRVWIKQQLEKTPGH